MTTTKLYPSLDEWFWLTVDDDVDSMGMIPSAGYSPEGWERPPLLGTQTIQVKLVCLGNTCNLEEANKKADEMGWQLVEGQAIESFMDMFPRYDGDGFVVFGGSEWLGPLGGRFVAYIDTYGFKNFRWSVRECNDHCRWLVTSKPVRN